MAIQEILRGRLSLGSYLTSLRGSLEFAVFAWDDPMPGFLGLPLFAAMVGRRFLKGRAV